jgi:hypothetical protein
MKLLTSKKFKLPVVYFITDRSSIKDLPTGVPFIYGDKHVEEHLIRLLEYEVIYNKAIESGMPFDFRILLQEAGFKDMSSYEFSHPIYMDIVSDKIDVEEIALSDVSSKHNSGKLSDYIKDSSAYVDINVLKNLNVFPVWMNKIEEAVNTNIHNFAVFNENMYNKKLEGMYGSLDLVSPNKNLIIIDISGSIPKAVSSTCLALSKNLAESFYADLLITGSKSTLYGYENLNDLDIEAIYDENGMDNDQAYFKALLTREKKIYKTAIVFGDNHSPSMSWSNEFNKNTCNISREDGQKMCLWEIEKLISFHTSSTEQIAGYADWFIVDEVEKINGWVKYLN